ncbi:hypothetical protein B0T22DRAFT_439041 [Podospora appendiculata]|uniref:F-box domain-containing protein n=1 Tax=Podospora appendiculata TaxID=314037 RepID=A0AAE0X826_9PEZI|nr:hypothetical protein B0T22DRAFT_439041 [Podospora appendiculata]
MTSPFPRLPFVRPTAASRSAVPSSKPKPTSSESPATDEDCGTRCPMSLMSLPPEIHLMISKELIYPDALSLKHTSRYFFHLVDTGIRLKISWLIERRQLHLECPNDKRCDLGSDLRFCRGSVSLLMQRRREHVECESRPGLGCLVYGTATCTHRRRLDVRLKRWMRVQLTSELRWILLILAPLVIGWLWMAKVVFLTGTPSVS